MSRARSHGVRRRDTPYTPETMRASGRHALWLLAAATCFLCATASASVRSAPSTFALVPYSARHELLPLHDAGARVRHLSARWALLQVPDTAASQLDEGSELIAPVLPGMEYGWVGGLDEDVYGVDVLLRIDDYALVGVPSGQFDRLHQVASPHMAVPLAVYAREALLPISAPRLETPNELRDAVIRTMLDDFDVLRWLNVVDTLSVNNGTRSRFTFRVRDVQMFDGSPTPDDACDQAADWIGQRLRGYGYLVDIDPFRHVRFTEGLRKSAEYGMRNVVATKPGSGPNQHRVLLLTAHYDSVASRTEGWEENWRRMSAPGANDNATGVATALEAARLFANLEFDFTVRFVFFAGEEIGLFGSKHAAEASRAAGEDIIGVLNTDMIGYEVDGSPDLHVVADARSEWMLDAVWAVARLTDTSLHVFPELNSDFVFSDHASYWASGYSALLFTEESDFESPEFAEGYHTVDDLPQQVNADYAAESARLVIASAAVIARPLLPGVPSVLPVTEQIRVIGASAFPNPYVVAADQPMRIQYQLNRPADVHIGVYNVAGGLVHTADFTVGSPHGRYGLNAPVVWTGRDRHGGSVGPGLYFVRIVATDVDGAMSQRTLRVMVAPSDAILDAYRARLSLEP